MEIKLSEILMRIPYGTYLQLQLRLNGQFGSIVYRGKYGKSQTFEQLREVGYVVNWLSVETVCDYEVPALVIGIIK